LGSSANNIYIAVHTLFDMVFIEDVERSNENEVEGGFRVSGRNVTLWVRPYQTRFGYRLRLTVSFRDEAAGGGWVNTPALWLDGKAVEEFARRLTDLSMKTI